MSAGEQSETQKCTRNGVEKFGWNLPPQPKDSKVIGKTRICTSISRGISRFSRYYLAHLCFWWKLQERLTSKAIIACSFSLCSSFVPGSMKDYESLAVQIERLFWRFGCHVESEPYQLQLMHAVAVAAAGPCPKHHHVPKKLAMQITHSECPIFWDQVSGIKRLILDPKVFFAPPRGFLGFTVGELNPADSHGTKPQTNWTFADAFWQIHSRTPVSEYQTISVAANNCHPLPSKKI